MSQKISCLETYTHAFIIGLRANKRTKFTKYLHLKTLIESKISSVPLKLPLVISQALSNALQNGIELEKVSIENLSEMGWFQLLVLAATLIYAQCNTEHFEHHQDSKKLSRTDDAGDYDETYYKDVGNASDVQNRIGNQTNAGNDDDEDSTNADYLDELGSTVDDVFQNFNSEPYLGTHFKIKETTELPTLTQQNDEVQDLQVTEPVGTLIAVPNYSNDTLPKCPDGYETYQDESAAICFIDNLPSVYPPPCPYPNTLDTHTLPHGITAMRTIWTKPLTKMFDNFGASFIPDTWTYNASQLACAVLYNSTDMAVPCSYQHPSICAYSWYAQHSFDDYCKNKYNNSCVAADLGTGEKCYCLVRSRTSRRNFCNKLAEPLEPYQNHLLLKTLTDSDVCWIGFYKSSDGEFKWSSSDALTNYTYWSFTTDFTKGFGAIGYGAWSLEEKDTLSCAICEVDVRDLARVRLRIQHNKSTNKVRLSVENPSEIFGGIDCYSYGNKYHLDVSGGYHNRLEVDVFDVNDIPRYYWCKALQMPHLTPTYSNRILAQATTTDSGHEYAVANKPEIPTSPYFMTELIFNETGNVLSHIHTVPSNYTIQDELAFLAKFISAEIKSSEVCLPSTTLSNNVTLNWAQTPMGSVILPSLHCVQDNGHPVTRRCSGDFLYGAAWDDVNGTCSTTPEINATLLYQNLIGSRNVSGEKLTLLEIHTLVNYVESVANFTEFIQAVNNLMSYPLNVFKEAQDLLNTTDTLLDTLNVRVSDYAITNITLDHLVIRILDLTSLGYYNDTDFDVVLKLTEQWHQDLKNCTVPPKLVITALKTGSFFGSRGVRGGVVLLTIPRTKCNLPETADVLIKVPVGKELKCSSWSYGSNDLMENIHGYWDVEDTALVNPESYAVCSFRLGRYSALVDQEECAHSGNAQQTVLVIMCIAATIVSVLSLLGVLATMVVFKSHTCNHVAVINLSVSSTIQLVLTLATILFKIEGASCIAMAAMVHYVTLAQFIWMAIVAWLEHNFYLSDQRNQEKYVMHVCFAAWGLPLLAVVVLVSASHFNYGKIAYEVCYAMGNNFTYSVLLPVSALLLITLLTFSKIIVSIKCSKKVKTHHFVKQTQFLQLKLAVVVYLLLGIAWGLGIFAAAVERRAIPYVYCIVGCVQAIMIFLFFIVLNEKTRTLWVGVKTICCMGKSKGYELTPKRKARRGKFSTSRF